MRWRVRVAASSLVGLLLIDNCLAPSAVPCLPVREDMHEKRNEAREKLSALSSHRFVQLVDDVLRELVGRYPELNVQTGGGRSHANRLVSHRCLMVPVTLRWTNMMSMCVHCGLLPVQTNSFLKVEPVSSASI